MKLEASDTGVLDDDGFVPRVGRHGSDERSVERRRIRTIERLDERELVSHAIERELPRDARERVGVREVDDVRAEIAKGRRAWWEGGEEGAGERVERCFSQEVAKDRESSMSESRWRKQNWWR
jgi:hypothetical protein